MLTLNEFVELRGKLINNEVSAEFVKKKLDPFWQDLKKGKRSWDTKDWIDRRKKFIKEKCEICSSTEILTIQHNSHPKTYNDFKREITKIHTNKLINTKIDKEVFINYVTNEYDYVPKLLCPKCEIQTPKIRVRLKPKYRCGDCKYEFENPIFRSVSELVSVLFEDDYGWGVRDKCFISKDKWRNKLNLPHIKYLFQKNIAINKNEESIEKQTLILTLDDNIKYLSFEDIITACKKCAYNEDLKGMELCPKCNTNYKGIEYSTCIECLPKEQQIKAKEKIEFGKQMQEIHKKLGID
tara:strand:+ start:4091 stop:4978 length:888 start_codon:yes stop_codon:yes gene_type:complete